MMMLLGTFSRRFHTWAKGWLVLVSLAALVGFVALTIPVAQAASGDTEGLDTRLSYTPETAFATVASYSDTGRATLQVFYLTGDIVNPILYTTFLALLISWLFQRGFDPESRLQILNVVPLGAAVFDLLENVSIVILLSVHPAQPRIVAWLATTGTTLKYLFIYGSFVLVLVGLAKLAAKATLLVPGKRFSKRSLE
jgi:hypothetical protein